MRERIIIGRNDQGYYYYVMTKVNNVWLITDRKKENVEKLIKNVLNSEISALRALNNLLIVKTNDDLVVIENYSQINHDKVFKRFNKMVENITINKDLFNKNMVLQKKSNHKKAIISSKVLASAAIIGMFILPPAEALIGANISTEHFSNTKQTIQRMPAYASRSSIGGSAITVKPVEDIKPLSETLKAPAQKAKLTKEEELLNNKIKEYANMYGIGYKEALTLVKENTSAIKYEYSNQEVGIIRILAKAFYDNPNISKTPVTYNMSSIERENLLLRFAKVHGVEDAETVATLLAVYRLETGNGQSSACVYGNNFGGLRDRNLQTGEYYVMSFKTPEIGAEAMVNSFLNIKNKTIQSRGYNPSRSLEQNMNRIYCGENSWPTKVSNLKQEVASDYDLNKYIDNEQPKQLIK